jgi:hypothetical protein
MLEECPLADDQVSPVERVLGWLYETIGEVMTDRRGLSLVSARPVGAHFVETYLQDWR